MRTKLYSKQGVYDTMKSSRYFVCFLCWFFNQLQELVGEMTTRLRVKDCFYDGRLGQYYFPVTIGGIREVASCLEGCSCNGTAIGWQSRFNCEWCCCERRVSDKEIVPSRTSFFYLLARVIYFLRIPLL